MKKHRYAAILLGATLIFGGTGCSSLISESGQTTAGRTAAATSWIKEQTGQKEKALAYWQSVNENPAASSLDKAVAEFAVNILSKNIASLIKENGDNNKELLASILRKDTKVEKNALPSLSSLKLESKNQLDNGKTMYRLSGQVFTSTPDKLYPVIVTIRADKAGKIEFFEVEND
ncbi:hypothetical protein [Aneurinibacillus tyrosinisolvens]|uniref:hypothetical protein n=1 Tax=Aneurinibacillus tyrosinisolvens TaxID=1443435 RepID=UPI00128DD277|nr:hypothetical protein [Aneurinibacillus tyrosinisolvens]